MFASAWGEDAPKPKFAPADRFRLSSIAFLNRLGRDKDVPVKR